MDSGMHRQTLGFEANVFCSVGRNSCFTFQCEYGLLTATDDLWPQNQPCPL